MTACRGLSSDRLSPEDESGQKIEPNYFSRSLNASLDISIRSSHTPVPLPAPSTVYMEADRAPVSSSFRLSHILRS
jgi:hypothetical protein